MQLFICFFPEACKEVAKKELLSGPEFVSGVIVKISSHQPLPSKKIIKVQCRNRKL